MNDEVVYFSNLSFLPLQRMTSPVFRKGSPSVGDVFPIKIRSRAKCSSSFNSTSTSTPRLHKSSLDTISLTTVERLETDEVYIFVDQCSHGLPPQTTTPDFHHSNRTQKSLHSTSLIR